MTSKIRRPHTSCEIRKPQVSASRSAWGNDSFRKFARTKETPVLRPKEFLQNSKFSDIWNEKENPMAEPIIEQNTQDVMNGKCEGSKVHGYGLKDADYFYLTTNRKEFDGQQGSPASFARPKSSKFYPSENKFLTSLYQDEYCGKNGNKELPQRSGTSSGHRKNKPHPPESFMIWKFPSKLPPLGQVHDLNEDILNKISKESLKTTYEVDYNLYRQSTQMKDELKNFYPTMKSDKPPYTLDSTSRFEYQKPQMHGNLKNNTTRYGCNARRCAPAIGAVPNIAENVPSMLIHEKTLYSQEFKDKTANAKTIQRPGMGLKLNKYVENEGKNDNENVSRLLKKLADLEDNKGPARLSDWEGPR